MTTPAYCVDDQIASSGLDVRIGNAHIVCIGGCAADGDAVGGQFDWGSVLRDSMETPPRHWVMVRLPLLATAELVPPLA